jgi:hypothetical protein
MAEINPTWPTNGEKPWGNKLRDGLDEVVDAVNDRPAYGEAVTSFVAEGDGIDPTGVEDSTVAIQAKIDAAAEVKGRVILPPGTFLVDDLELPAYVVVEGFSGGQYRFGAGAQAFGGTILKHVEDSENPIVRNTGGGAGLRNLLLDGNGAPGTGLKIEHGFEFRLDTVRIAYVDGCGLDADSLCNASFRDLYIDNCGSSTEPLMKINAIYPRSTNTVDIVGLTLERALHPSAHMLTIGDYVDADHDYYPEFIRITNAHIEATTDNGGVATTASLVKLRNFRNVDFVAPFIYGGPGVMIEHVRDEAHLANALGGIRIIGGELYGRQASTGNQPTNLVKLTTGDNFSMEGTRVEEYSSAAVRAESGYGVNVYVSPTVQSQKARTTLVSDSRTATPNPFFFAGNIQSTGADSRLNLGPDSAPMNLNVYYPVRGTSITTYQTVQGVMRLGQIHVGRNCVIDEIGVEVTTAGSTGALLRLGIYRVSRWVNGTVELVKDAGTVDATSTGFKSVTGLNQFVAVGETLMLAVVPQGSPVTAPIVRANTGTLPSIGHATALTISTAGIIGSSESSVSGALPSTHTIVGTGTVPRVLIKATG